MIEEIRRQFVARFNKEPLIVTSPGRVNLIGEHTDYNEGFVLPGAIDKKIVVAMAPAQDEEIEAYAIEFDETLRFPLTNITPQKSWKNYILGVTHFFQEQTGMLPHGLKVMIDGDVPVGGGMSSSAALCSAYGFALNHLFERGLSRLELALIGQKTEHVYVGAKVGIMDQFASLHGREGHVIKLDCRSLEYEYIPFDFPDYSIVMVNSMVSHSIASSEYNVRRQQCENGVEIIRQKFPGVKSLRDVNLSQLEQVKPLLEEVVYRRCHYVVEEKDRLFAGCEALRQGSIQDFGKLMYQTHEGLSKEYEVSCPELDFLVEQAKQESSVVGSRMMGGGFGGCTINLVKRNETESFTDTIRKAFEKEFAKLPEVYVVKIGDGARVE